MFSFDYDESMLWKKKISNISSLREIFDDGTTVILNYNEAIHHQNSYLLIYGDECGQIYLTIPLRKVKIGPDRFGDITTKVDSYGWANPRSCGYTLELAEPGTEAYGGMGGGKFEKELWIHPELRSVKREIELLLGVAS